MTKEERRKRLENLRKRMRETDALWERERIETARFLARIDRILARGRAAR